MSIPAGRHKETTGTKASKAVAAGRCPAQGMGGFLTYPVPFTRGSRPHTLGLTFSLEAGLL